MLKTLYLFLDSEVLIDLISLSLAASFSLSSHHHITDMVATRGTYPPG